MGCIAKENPPKPPPADQEIVNFNAFDLVQITLFAERQHCVKQELKVKSKKYDVNKTEYELHYIGAMGEWAIQKNYDTELDYKIYHGGDSGIDLTINGWDCQVKTFTYTGPNPEFYIDNIGEFKGDVCIGVRILSPIRVEIMGCISRKRFKKNATKKEYGYGERLSIPSDLLWPVQKLVDTDRKPKNEVPGTS